MARQSLQKVYADFRRGWVDVASPLQQPEGTVKDIVNFDINIDGTLSKRSGLEKAGDAFTSAIFAGSDTTFDAHLWENVGKDVNKTFLVIRRTDTVDFYDVSHGNIDLSSDFLVESISIPVEKSVTRKRMDTANAMGRLFFALNTKGVGYFEYNASSDDVSVNYLNLQFRDLDIWEGPSRKATGFEESSDFQIEPWHQYNLRNAGWPNPVAYVSQDSNADEGVFEDADPVGYTKRQIGIWPRISIPFAAGRAGGGAGVDEQTAFSPWIINNNYFGDSPPPVGRNIFDVSEFTRVGVLQTQTEGQSGGTFQSNGTHEETYTLSEYPSKVAFYAGRIWYAGDYDYSSDVSTARVKSPVNATGTIFFSQTIKNDINNAEKCYQENDPTAEDINQLLATDGGSLSIKEIGSIKALVPLSTALYIISDQGVWRVTGLDFNSFSADSYSVDKITDKGILSEDSFTVSENTLFLFNKDGLFALSSGGTAGQLSYDDISTPLIKNFFYDLPTKSVENALIKFNKNRNILTCFLAVPNEGQTVTDTFFKTKYNTILVFNADLGAFYRYEIDLGTNEILDAIDGLETSVVFTENLVFDSLGATYTDSSGEDYFLPGDSNFSVNDITLHLLIKASSSNLYSATFSDSSDLDDLGAAYEGKVDIGFDSIGNFISDKKQAPYILAYLDNSNFKGYEEVAEDEMDFVGKNSCKLSYSWDWATTPKGDQELYRLNRLYVPVNSSDPFNYGVDIIKTKNRVRGRGVALSMTLTSPAGNDAKILGLGVQYVGEGN